MGVQNSFFFFGKVKALTKIVRWFIWYIMNGLGAKIDSHLGHLVAARFVFGIFRSLSNLIGTSAAL